MATDEGGSAVLRTDLATRCEPVMVRGNDILQRVQDVGNTFTTQLKECSQNLTRIRASFAGDHQVSSRLAQRHSSAHGSSAKVEVVQQVLLRKVLAIDRGQAATVSATVSRPPLPNMLLSANRECVMRSAVRYLACSKHQRNARQHCRVV